ncbi:DNA helicase [Candidatus Methylacidiphilum fumarolicum]|uniref:ATP-dependent DNA helicase n=1 Tax=Candidatus Methylacidiphilum fumarolicum TaxID=591154 RepID=UPI0002FA68DB|nr:helicase C-terminal domain-containing protein [Candidatus Methylacidiphilum fumarolicum]MBW6414138.1 DEAD/DEAH box helicase family protein [Candidatus Methylacidiphilum fumarolicum]TFE73841.1 DNA helicase [Candidatus Methylacidiphilum fumarolicum]TFE75662.1 DNA helicase [Candidatus Methylacidiphilum fumarolicum]
MSIESRNGFLNGRLENPEAKETSLDPSFYFSPSGPLAQAAHFEYRPQQKQMAEAIYKSLQKRKHLIVEAPTGTGKSLAYLLAALCYCQKNAQRGVISTHTLNLQDQLLHKDIPLLKKIFPKEFSVVLLKGRQNYICPKRLEKVLKHATDLFPSFEMTEIMRIYDWSVRTQTGDIEELHPLPSFNLWSQICSEPGICHPRNCANNPRCFYHLFREQSAHSDLTIVNHALYFSLLGRTTDSQLQKEEGLPFGENFVIFDEAHTIEKIASNQLGFSTSKFRLQNLLFRLFNPITHKGLLLFLKDSNFVPMVHKAYQEVGSLFKSIAENLVKLSIQEHRILEPIPLPNALPETLNTIVEKLSHAVANLPDKEIKEEITNCIEKITLESNAIINFFEMRIPDHVYWIELEEPNPESNVQLLATPLDVGPLLQSFLYEKEVSVIMTSATLKVANSFSFFQNRVGLFSQTLSLESPFDYGRQMKILIPKDMPDPSSSFYEAALAFWIERLVKQTAGSALVLFTNRKTLANMVEALSSKFAELGFPLYVQDGKTSRHKLLKLFKEAKHSILFGMDSFWQGIDVPGDSLKNVIITKLPFSSPDHPQVQAKCEKLEKQGLNAFVHYSLPEAVLKFRQGIGRLIRSKEDKGIVAVLDSRILSKSYGKIFLNSIPNTPIEIIE